jgi:hypothetical protein
MADPYCGITVNFYIFGRYVSVSTPEWSRERHRPSWLPKWEYTVIDDLPCELSKMFMLDWFFHLTVMWGPPSNRLAEMRDPQPVPDDDDDDDFDDDFDDDERLCRKNHELR